ncbi:MAG: glycosyltransferase family 2 protein [Thermodesulfobacteriota bacterium]
MSVNHPKVSIGLPVYNAENYIQKALDSILAQDYTDFELIISDNASNDRTEQICRAYAKKDERIRYYRNNINYGASKNFNNVFELAKGSYFKWAAHDDLIAPDYLSKCVEVLETDPSIVLCYSRVQIIDSHGSIVCEYKVNIRNADSNKPHERFKELITVNHWGIEVFGLFRSSVLENTKLIANYPGSDRTLMAELSLLGSFHEIPEYLFFSRDHSERSTRQGTIHSRANWFDTSKSNQTVFPQWRLLLELFRCIKNSSLNIRQKTYCYLSLGNWLTSNCNYARLILDLAMAVEPRSWQWAMKIKKSFQINSKSNKESKDKLFSQKSEL